MISSQRVIQSWHETFPGLIPGPLHLEEEEESEVREIERLKQEQRMAREALLKERNQAPQNGERQQQ